MELVYRSSYARERLRDACHQPAFEPAMRHFTDFLAASPANTLTPFRHLADADWVDKVLEEFEKWFVLNKAPLAAKMTAPQEWFPKARMMRRRFIFHCGPTNSGKTHAALESLVAAKSGVYCAPLKALASQVWKRINERVACDLLIGDERRFGGSAEHVSCTVEMAPVDLSLDVAVIDEIQLLEDPDRGWAWTRAVLGVPAREVHLCGEARALPIIKKLLWLTKEEGQLSIVEHRRLTPLHLSSGPLGSTSPHAKLQNGDCVVVFSKKGVFQQRELIRRHHPAGAVVSVVYGALPFAVREAETDRFNDGVRRHIAHPETHPPHILVSTDAVAYGLNLNIRRVVFATLQKFGGPRIGLVTVNEASMMQIAGRAGRFGLSFGQGNAASDGGYCTTIHPKDFDMLAKAYAATSARVTGGAVGEGQPSANTITRCGLLPTMDVLVIYAEGLRGPSTGCVGAAPLVPSSVAIPRCGVPRLGGEIADSVASSSAVPAASASACPPPPLLMFGDVVANFVASATAAADTFFLCDMAKGVVAIARLLDQVASLSLRDRAIFCFAPTSLGGPSDQQMAAALLSWSTSHATGGKVVLSIQEDVVESMTTLEQLEEAFRLVEIYGWLGWRFRNTFVDIDRTDVVKRRLVARISTLIAST